MIIDVLFLITIALAVFKGWSKGLIAGVFSLAALVLGAAAALKLSAQFSLYLQTETGHPSPLWPVVAFVLIFIVVAIVVKLLAAVINKIFQAIMLGWLNRLAGIVFYALAYIILFSIGLWFANQMNLLSPDLKESSKVYNRIMPLGPVVISKIAEWMPWFKDLFKELENFFGQIPPLIKP